MSAVADPGDAAAVVYDLDGTLVRLAVDWGRVAEALRALYAEAGVATDGWDVWDCFRRADDHGLAEPVEAVLAEHELAGADRSERLPAAADIPALHVPVGVCSLNAEAACRRALERHGLAAHVDVVVGRDTVTEVKPDPAPLLAAIDRLDAAPAEALFVGNGRRDEETARRAGVRFAYVDGSGPSE